ncbi:hypothetical protein EJ110_NYTH60059 [Nymphaea thermarum]|nr:hypothetical protein EJ110_NYTH60059 [Nymphaea thermarum]
MTDSLMGGIRNCPHYKMVVVPGVVQWLPETLVSRVVSSPSERDLTCGRKDLGRSYLAIYRPVLQMKSEIPTWRSWNCEEESTSSVLLLPCRHLCLCSGCAAAVDTCPICKSTKTATVQVYLS